MSRLRLGLAVIVLPLAIALGVAWLLDRDEFSPPRLAGAPLLVAENDPPLVLVLTSHLEETAFVPSLFQAGPRQQVHMDLWAFAARDMAPVWVRRVQSVPYHSRFQDPKILGSKDGTVWVTAPAIAAFAVADGSPRSPDGPAQGAVELRRPPERRFSADSFLRARGVVVDGMWYGLARPHEAASLARDPGRAIERLEYRLFSARVTERMDSFFRRPIREYDDFVPAPHGASFHHGGLITVDVGGRRHPVVLSDPTRLLVLHDVTADGVVRRVLSCVHTDGRVCWRAPLGLSDVQAVELLAGARPGEQALIVTGQVRLAGQTEHEAAEAVLRVSLTDGTLRVLNVGAIEPAALKAGLAGAP
jgi:hypothetical protein